MSRELINECEDGNLEEAKQRILNGEDVNMIDFPQNVKSRQ